MSFSASIPDFDDIIRRVCEGYHISRSNNPEASTVLQSALATALRGSWNARGIVDIKVVDATLSTQMGVPAATPYVNNLTRALKALDQS